MLDYLPERLLAAVGRYVGKGLAEIRIRAGKPVFLTVNGKDVRLDLKVGADEVEKTVLRLTKRSVYCYEDLIKRGFLIGENGERIGVAGECVIDGGVKFIKNITSLCVRIPFAPYGCSYEVCKDIFDSGLKNVIIISPPGGGKTTFLRDMSRYVSDEMNKNVLMIDEKCEFSGVATELGDRTDVLRYAGKAFGLKYGVLNMRPDVIVLDELSVSGEISQLVETIYSGVNVLCSAHGANLNDVRSRSTFDEAFSKKAFDVAVILSSADRVGTVVGVEYLC